MKNLILNFGKRSKLYSLLLCLIFFFPIAIALIMISSYISHLRVINFLLLLFTGWFTWTFTEYMIHRFWMHHSVKGMNQAVYKHHMHHHKHPTDLKINNLHRTILLIACIFITCLSIWWNNYFTLCAGFLIGILWYSFFHVILHKKIAGKIFPILQEYHIHHHTKYPDTCFNFSITWWDRIFGTMPPSDAKISESLRKFYFSGHHKH